MAKKAWAAFPHPDKAFDYDGAKLAKAWSDSARRRSGAVSRTKNASRRCSRRIRSSARMPRRSPTSLQDAWRAFHRGDFEAAHDAGIALKALGASVAVKAGGIHATYLVDGAAAKTARYESLVRLADEAVAALPDEANSHYATRSRSAG